MSEVTQEQSSQFTKTMPWLISLFVFVLSLLAGARTVSDADHAEFATVAFYGGIAHPPGYPLYSLLLRAVAAFGTDVWLLSGLSAGFAGLAAFIIGLLARLRFRCGHQFRPYGPSPRSRCGAWQLGQSLCAAF